MKRCSTPLIIREMQIKTTFFFMRYHLILIRMAIIKKSTNNKSLKGCGESECGSATVARRANNQAVTTPNERILRLLGLLSQGDLYPFLWCQGPILVPQATGALTSLRCTLRSHSLRVRPFPRCLSPLWALLCIQTEVPAHPSLGGRGRGELGREPWSLCQGFGIKFFIH